MKNNHINNKMLRIVSFAPLLAPVGVGVLKTIENHELKTIREKATAIVCDKRKVGSKGTIRCFYQFSYGGVSYFGFGDTDKFQAGDTLTVLYLKNAPNTNRTVRFLTQ